MGTWGTGLLQSDTALDAVDAVDMVAELETVTEIRNWFVSRFENGDEYWAIEVLAVAKDLIDNKWWTIRDFGHLIVDIIIPALFFEMVQVRTWGKNADARLLVLVNFYNQLKGTNYVSMDQTQVCRQSATLNRRRTE